jgi:hypothetical protein
MSVPEEMVAARSVDKSVDKSVDMPVDMPCPIDLRGLPRRRIAAMRRAARDLFAVLDECQASGRHPVRDVLAAAEADAFAQWAHYPPGDVEDPHTGSAWYYHAHGESPARRWSEHGHFHCFAYTELVRDGVRPWALPENPDAVNGGLIHLAAISIDPRGVPVRLFAPNRWVTGEWLYGARDVVPLVERFAIRAAQPCALTSRWLGALLRLLHPQIDRLLRERDRVLAAQQARDPRGFSERNAIEVAASIEIDLDGHLEALARA